MFNSSLSLSQPTYLFLKLPINVAKRWLSEIIIPELNVLMNILTTALLKINLTLFLFNYLYLYFYIFYCLLFILFIFYFILIFQTFC